MGAYCTLNGHDAFKATIGLPRIGAWHADVAVGASLAIPAGSPVTLLVGEDELGQVQFKGTVKRGDVYLDTLILRVVGGAGGLSKKLGARAYRNTPVRLVVTDLLSSVGEQLSPLSDPGTLKAVLAHWSRHESVAGAALRNLVQLLPGVAWRVLQDGTVFIGPEAWVPSKLKTFTLLGSDPRLDMRTIYAPVPIVFPGEALVVDPAIDLAARHISKVEHRIGSDCVELELALEAT